MPIKTVAGELVPLREHRCQRSDCQKLFYLCRSCFRGQRYCSTECGTYARRLQHRAASARYQRSPDGRRSHCEWQNAYRQRRRASRSSSPTLVTDSSSISSATRASCGSDDASRPVPLPSKRPPNARRPRSYRVPPSGLHCLVCRRPGYLRKPDSYEPNLS